jgi:F-type H+-transporting ATPase subunit epsilon
MASTDTFHCSVITPERKVLECDATFVAFPAYDGEMGVLPRRAPLVCKLGIGPLRIETLDPDHDHPDHDGPHHDRKGAAPSRDSDPHRDRKGAASPERHVFFIDEGFAQVIGNHLTILTEQARRAEDIDAAAADQALIEARAIKITDEASHTARTKAIKRAQIQLKLIKPAV